MLHHYLMNRELREYLRRINRQQHERRYSNSTMHESIMDERIDNDEVSISTFFSFENFT
jgi:hypothetical protein